MASGAAPLKTLAASEQQSYFGLFGISAELSTKCSDLKPGDQRGFSKFRIIYFLRAESLATDYLLQMGPFGGGEGGERGEKGQID